MDRRTQICPRGVEIIHGKLKLNIGFCRWKTQIFTSAFDRLRRFAKSPVGMQNHDIIFSRLQKYPELGLTVSPFLELSLHHVALFMASWHILHARFVLNGMSPCIELRIGKANEYGNSL